MIHGLAHVALYTPYLNETIRFYQEVFQAENLGMFDLPHKGCYLSLSGDLLEIFESAPLGDGCFKHIALACDDVDFYYDRALSHGATSHVPPKNIIHPHPARIAFVKGICGEQIELFNAQ